MMQNQQSCSVARDHFRNSRTIHQSIGPETSDQGAKPYEAYSTDETLRRLTEFGFFNGGMNDEAKAGIRTWPKNPHDSRAK
jgi:hypothetical protein